MQFPRELRRIAMRNPPDGLSLVLTDFICLNQRREYSQVVRSFDDQGEPRPKGADAFSGEMIPGWTDGDFPPWLQPEMPGLIPTSLLERFGKQQATWLNGSFWWLPPESADSLCAELSALGWKTEHAPSLRFW